MPFWGSLGLPGSPFGWLWGDFGASQAASDAQKTAVLERREAEKRRTPKFTKKTTENQGCLMFASWGLLGSALGGLFGAVLEASWAILRSRRSLLERSCDVLGVSGTSPMTPLIALGVLGRLGKTPCEARGAASRPVWRVPKPQIPGVRSFWGEGEGFSPRPCI